MAGAAAWRSLIEGRLHARDGSAIIIIINTMNTSKSHGSLYMQRVPDDLVIGGAALDRPHQLSLLACVCVCPHGWKHTGSDLHPQKKQQTMQRRPPPPRRRTRAGRNSIAAPGTGYYSSSRSFCRRRHTPRRLILACVASARILGGQDHHSNGNLSGNFHPVYSLLYATTRYICGSRLLPSQRSRPNTQHCDQASLGWQSHAPKGRHSA